MLEGVLSHEDTTGGKGDIRAGEFQRMLASSGIEHQEINNTDDPVRVIQIWFMADPQSRQLPPQYQQLGQDELPSARREDAKIYQLIGNGSPMDSHVQGRLTAAVVNAQGTTTLESPNEDEDLFLYVTDGAGIFHTGAETTALGQYDVILARSDTPEVEIRAGESELHFLSFYLPRFVPTSR